MKAILLAGGLGTRGKPYTDYFPKAMIPIEGRPIIDYIIRYLTIFSHISDIIIVCEFDRLGKQIINYFEGKESIIGKSISFIEDKKCGTGGALLEVEERVKQDKYFMVWFADNLVALNVDDMVKQYCATNNKIKSKVTGIIAVRKEKAVETGRILLEYDIHSQLACDIRPVKSFIEKGILELELPEATGIYLFTNKIFDHLHRRAKQVSRSVNLSSDIFTQIPKSGDLLFSYLINKNLEWIDIESLSHLERNRETVMKVLRQMGF